MSRRPVIAGEALAFGAPAALDLNGTAWAAGATMDGIVVRRRGNRREYVEAGQSFDLQTEGGILAALPAPRFVNLRNGRIHDAS